MFDKHMCVSQAILTVNVNETAVWQTVALHNATRFHTKRAGNVERIMPQLRSSAPEHLRGSYSWRGGTNPAGSGDDRYRLCASSLIWSTSCTSSSWQRDIRTRRSASFECGTIGVRNVRKACASCLYAFRNLRFLSSIASSWSIAV